MNGVRKSNGKFLWCLVFLFLLTLISVTFSFGDSSPPPAGEEKSPFYHNREFERIKRSVELFQAGSLKDLSKYLSHQPLFNHLGDMEIYMLGIIALSKGDIAGVEGLHKALATYYPGSFFPSYLTVDRAFVSLKLGRKKNAYELIESLKGQPQYHRESSRYLYTRGMALMARDYRLKGARLLAMCLGSYPGTEPAILSEKTLIPLLTTGKGVSGWKGEYASLALDVSKALSAGGKYDSAIRVLTSWRNHVEGELSLNMDLLAADAYRRQNRYTKAIELLLEKGMRKGEKLSGERLFFAGLYNWYRGKESEALKLFDEVVNRFGGKEVSFRAAYNVGRMYEEKKDWGKAFNYFRLAAGSPEIEVRDKSLTRSGLVRLLAGKPASAGKIFGENMDKGVGEETYFRNLFLRGLAREKGGDKEGALEDFRKILSSGKGGLYYFLSLRKMGSMRSWNEFGNLEFKGVSPSHLLSKLEKDQDKAGEKSVRRLRRTIMFQRLGLFPFAIEEMKGMHTIAPGLRGNLRGPFISYISGDLKKGIKLSYSSGFQMEGEMLSGFIKGRHIRYPSLAFIYRVARRDFPDPYFIHSIIRQESLFDYSAVSGAGAVGLGQIMPGTGKRLARRMRMGNFTRGLLFDPAVNVQLSAKYLATLTSQFEGNLPAVAAAYNAGEAAAIRWINKSKKDPFLFADLIGYEETRKYVRRVFRNYLNYLQLYASGFNAFVEKP